MPVYQYRCSDCDCEFEQKQSFTDNGDAACPRCGHKARKLFIPVPVIFKGSGFYVTDHRSESNSTASKFDPSKPAPKAESQPESKPESKVAEPAKAPGSAV